MSAKDVKFNTDARNKLLKYGPLSAGTDDGTSPKAAFTRRHIGEARIERALVGGRVVGGVDRRPGVALDGRGVDPEGLEVLGEGARGGEVSHDAEVAHGAEAGPAARP